MKKILLYTLLCLSFAAYGQVQKGSLLIKNGTVITVTKGTLANTDVLIENGKITKVGANLTAPAGVAVVDATNQFVMPGIIDAHSHIGIDAVNEPTNPVTAEVAVGDAIDPFDIGVYRALAGGVTISHAMHGSANAIGGQCQTIKHRYGTLNPEEYKMEGAPRTIKFALGENPIRTHGIFNRMQPRTRMGVEAVIRNAFSEAKEYQAKWDKYNAQKAAEAASKKKTPSNLVPPTYNRRMETLAGVLKGEVLIHCHSYRADEILMLLNVCKDFGIRKVCFQHANEAFKVAPELAAYGATASVFADWWAYKFEVYYSTAYNAAILAKNGVATSINSDSGELIRHLYHEAAKTQKYGDLTDDQALAMITINPASQLGIENRVGSIEVGKDGDVAIFSAHPLSIYAIPQKTIVDGVIRFDIKDADDKRLYIDPKENVLPTIQHGYQIERCMQDTEFFFGGK